MYTTSTDNKNTIFVFYYLIFRHWRMFE